MIDFQYVQVAMFALSGGAFFVLTLRLLAWFARSIFKRN